MSNRPVNSMPQSSPLYTRPPTEFIGHKRLSIYCEVNESILEDAIPSPLNIISNTVEIFVFNTETVRYSTGREVDNSKEGGVVVPVEIEDNRGGHVLYEYVTSDHSICGGREIWGYPKKIADVRFEENQNQLFGKVVREGESVIEIRFNPGDDNFEVPTLNPRFQIKQIPKANGEGYDVNKIIKVGFEGGAKNDDQSGTTGAAKVDLGGELTDLAPHEIIGAQVSVSDSALDWGEEIADLTNTGGGAE